MFDFHDFVSSWSHLIMAAFMVFAGIILLRITYWHPRINRLSVQVYVSTAVILYTFSGLFHGVNHVSEDDRRFWQILDQSAIFALIYGSNVPLLVYLLPARRRNWLLVLMGGIAVVGMMTLWTKPKHEVLAAAYVAIGLLGMFPLRTYFRYIGWWGILWVFLMAGSYTLGAICEAVKWPTLVAEGTMRLTYHEMLHLFVIAGTTAHTILLVKYVLPTANRTVKRKITVDRTTKIDHNSHVAASAIPPALDRF